jgi:group I intron endonuclease
MIYKITNNVNHKSYIGFSEDAQIRWNDHINGKGSKLVYAAIQKYGIKNFTFEILSNETVEHEDRYIQEYNTMSPNGYNLVEGGGLPPNKKGWKPSEETLSKRRKSLRGIKRTETWRENLSKSKSGSKNPRYGKKEDPALTEARRINQIRTKNLPNYDTYKEAIKLMDDGLSANTVAKQLGIGRGVCFALKNRSHGIFLAFPELK